MILHHYPLALTTIFLKDLSGKEDLMHIKNGSNYCRIAALTHISNRERRDTVILDDATQPSKNADAAFISIETGCSNPCSQL